MTRPWLNERDWQIYRFEFNPPRITTSEYFVVGGRKLIRFEHNFFYRVLDDVKIDEQIGFANEPPNWNNIRVKYIDGRMYTTRGVADSILACHDIPAEYFYGHDPNADRFKNIVAGVLSLSPVTCLDLVVRVVCFL